MGERKLVSINCILEKGNSHILGGAFAPNTTEKQNRDQIEQVLKKVFLSPDESLLDGGLVL